MKVIQVLRTYQWYFAVLVLASVGYFLFGLQDSTEGSERTYTAGIRNISQTVQLSGDVSAVKQLGLSFKAAGRVGHVYVAQGEYIATGTVVAELERDSLEADLLGAQSAVKKAEANLALVRAQNRGVDTTLDSARTKLVNTKIEQDALVENAYRELLTNDIQAYQVDAQKNLVPPTITGNYKYADKGFISLSFYNSEADAGYSARVSGLVTDILSFESFGEPVALGDTGLFVTLPSLGSGGNYGRSAWIIPIPNDRSSTYQSALSAFVRAQKTQVLMVTEAEASLKKIEAEGIQDKAEAVTAAQERQAQALVEEAQAQVVKVQASIEDTKITAPFSGTVGQLTYEVGETVSAGDSSGVTLVSGGNFELSMSIPEIDVAKVHVGDSARIVLDVYGEAEVWNGVLTEIELVETEVEGVPVYTSKIQVENPDERIRIGMNARAAIVVSEVTDVVAIPFSYLIKNGEGYTVLIKNDAHSIEERSVLLGIRGTDNFVEIKSGLEEGAVLVYPAKE